MIAIVTVLVALPAGFLLRDRLSAVVAYLGVYSWAYTFQCVYLLRFWVGGDNHAFPKDPQGWPAGYGVVTAAILLVGLALVFLGHRLGAGRRARRTVTEPTGAR